MAHTSGETPLFARGIPMNHTDIVNEIREPGGAGTTLAVPAIAVGELSEVERSEDHPCKIKSE